MHDESHQLLCKSLVVKTTEIKSLETTSDQENGDRGRMGNSSQILEREGAYGDPGRKVITTSLFALFKGIFMLTSYHRIRRAEVQDLQFDTMTE